MSAWRLLGLSLLAAGVHAGDEPQAPEAAPEADGKPQVVEVISGEELKKLQKTPVTLRKLTPKESISLDQAVDLPSDI